MRKGRRCRDRHCNQESHLPIAVIFWCAPGPAAHAGMPESRAQEPVSGYFWLRFTWSVRASGQGERESVTCFYLGLIKQYDPDYADRLRGVKISQLAQV